MSKHSADVMDFKRKMKSNRQPKQKRVYSKNHKWRNPKKDPLTEHYMVILNIPEGMKEYYKDRTVPAPRYSRMHTFIRAFAKKGETLKPGTLNLFPESTVSDIPCTGDETCIVCQRIKEMKDTMGIEGYGNKAEVPDELSKDDKKIAQSLVQALDSYGKGKKRVVFAGIDFQRDPANEKQWKMKLDRYSISEKYWNDDFMPVLCDERDEDEDDWKYEDHCDDEFTYEGVTKKLSEFSKDEQSVIFLENTDNKYPVVWDMVDARMLKYVEDGDFGDSKSVMSVKKAYPYFPTEYVKETKGDEKKKLTKLAKKSKELYEWILTNIDTLPDVDEYCPAEMTAEKQKKLLNLDKEKQAQSKMEPIKTKGVDEIKDEFFEDDEEAHTSDTAEDSDPDIEVVAADPISESDTVGDDFFDGDETFESCEDDFDIEEPI